MHIQFFSDVMVRKPALFRAMLAFNGELDAPAAWECPAEWDVPGLDAGALCAELAHRSPVSLAWRLAGPEEGGFWDFADESRRLAFLDADTLARLGMVFGVCVHAVEMARIITREQVLALREGLGEPLYRYGIQRGQYQLGGVRQLFLTRDVREPLLERVRRHGLLALALCRAEWPPALTSRTAHVFPEPVEEPDPPSPAVRRAVWGGLKKVLLKEVAPQWAPCFD